MNDAPSVEFAIEENEERANARNYLTPECKNAALLVSSNLLGKTSFLEAVLELGRQTTAINRGDMSRAEDMLVSQAHSLDALFVHLASRALSSKNMGGLESYMRLALKAQNQARATLQTLGELKTPKQVAFVKQANIGNQVQVNNGIQEKPARTRKTKKAQNELLEVEHGERLDARATGAAGGADPAMATLGTKHRATKHRG
ncbi:hypothetical protein PS645_01840 [Pseudomonas fluorescens]|uniref:Uncharacterized protein n=1 Tax=Pseudomonas fluorescens TaxID=294 RepID=A0A5E6S169_PSEFL|nr:hypothetical protein [Pseudomonas fluorescens]VVM72603.1 hypothetical protein PS645_01840 [Pseudomonas fluorescens]